MPREVHEQSEASRFMFQSVALPWAVHIGGGVLSWPMLAAGFALAAILALAAAWRLRDDEVPRIALLTAAFFVASSIHIKLGPSSVHLLLNGLVGVILGRRAPLAILIGVTLQALLIPHGDLSTIGVNACTETLPALLTGGLFGLLSRLRGEDVYMRSALVSAAALVWGVCLLFGLAVLWTNPLDGVVRWTSAGLVVSVENLRPAFTFMSQPLVLAGLGLFAALAVLLERRVGSPPGFACGVLVGVLAVVATTVLTGLVLLIDGAEQWGLFVSVVFVAHLPLALLEGVILGTIVAFLGRVKPEMLQPTRTKAGNVRPPASGQTVQTGPVQALLAILAVLALAGPVRAHSLEIAYSVDLAAKRVTIKSFYETDDVPEKATVQVRRSDGSLLAEGPLDEKGQFRFSYGQAEDLSVHVRAPGGHRALRLIKAAELEGKTAGEPPRPSRLRDLLLGLAVVLGAGAFAMSWRNSVRLRRLVEAAERRV
jgi:cobalt/nickel transport system permease protein